MPTKFPGPRHSGYLRLYDDQGKLVKKLRAKVQAIYCEEGTYVMPLEKVTFVAPRPFRAGSIEWSNHKTVTKLELSGKVDVQEGETLEIQ